MAMQRPSFKPDFGDGSRFRDLILYASKECEGDPTFGAIKLNKILFYADFYAYRILGQPITGATYQKLQEGPAPREMLRERATLLDVPAAQLVAKPYFNGVQHRLVVIPGCEVDPEKAFSPEERTIIDEVVTAFWGRSAREVSDYSHHERGWNLVDYGETIPYETAWLSVDPLEEEEIKAGSDLANQRGGR